MEEIHPELFINWDHTGINYTVYRDNFDVQKFHGFRE